MAEPLDAIVTTLATITEKARALRSLVALNDLLIDRFPGQTDAIQTIVTVLGDLPEADRSAQLPEVVAGHLPVGDASELLREYEIRLRLSRDAQRIDRLVELGVMAEPQARAVMTELRQLGEHAASAADMPELTALVKKRRIVPSGTDIDELALTPSQLVTAPDPATKFERYTAAEDALLARLAVQMGYLDNGRFREALDLRSRTVVHPDHSGASSDSGETDRRRFFKDVFFEEGWLSAGEILELFNAVNFFNDMKRDYHLARLGIQIGVLRQPAVMGCLKVQQFQFYHLHKTGPDNRLSALLVRLGFNRPDELMRVLEIQNQRARERNITRSSAELKSPSSRKRRLERSSPRRRQSESPASTNAPPTNSTSTSASTSPSASGEKPELPTRRRLTGSSRQRRSQEPATPSSRSSVAGGELPSGVGDSGVLKVGPAVSDFAIPSALPAIDAVDDPAVASSPGGTFSADRDVSPTRKIYARLPMANVSAPELAPLPDDDDDDPSSANTAAGRGKKVSNRLPASAPMVSDVTIPSMPPGLMRAPTLGKRKSNADSPPPSTVLPVPKVSKPSPPVEAVSDVVVAPVQLTKSSAAPPAKPSPPPPASTPPVVEKKPMAIPAPAKPPTPSRGTTARIAAPSTTPTAAPSPAPPAPSTAPPSPKPSVLPPRPASRSAPPPPPPLAPASSGVEELVELPSAEDEVGDVFEVEATPATPIALGDMGAEAIPIALALESVAEAVPIAVPPEIREAVPAEPGYEGFEADGETDTRLAGRRKLLDQLKRSPAYSQNFGGLEKEARLLAQLLVLFENVPIVRLASASREFRGMQDIGVEISFAEVLANLNVLPADRLDQIIEYRNVAVVDCVNPACDTFLTRRERRAANTDRCPGCGADFRLVMPQMDGSFDPNATGQFLAADFATGSEADEAPSWFGRFRLNQISHEGPVAVRFEGFDPDAAVKVSLKLFHEPYQEFVEQKLQPLFARLSKIKHPGLEPILEAGSIDGEPYTAMPSREGTRDLETIFASGHLDPLQLAEWVIPVADALAKTAKAKVFHLDVRPVNLFRRLGKKEGLVIGDFELARLRGRGVNLVTETIFGSPVYLAPEVFSKNFKPSATVDVYGLGMTLYEGVCGCLPFTDSDPRRLIEQIRQATPERPGKFNRAVPKSLEKIILKCLAKKPANRFADTGELAHALKATLAEAK